MTLSPPLPDFAVAGGVGVGAEGKASVVVSQHTADGFHVHSVLERQGCKEYNGSYRSERQRA